MDCFDVKIFIQAVNRFHRLVAPLHKSMISFNGHGIIMLKDEVIQSWLLSWADKEHFPEFASEEIDKVLTHLTECENCKKLVSRYSKRISYLRQKGKILNITLLPDLLGVNRPNKSGNILSFNKQLRESSQKPEARTLAQISVGSHENSADMANNPLGNESGKKASSNLSAAKPFSFLIRYGMMALVAANAFVFGKLLYSFLSQSSSFELVAHTESANRLAQKFRFNDKAKFKKIQSLLNQMDSESSLSLIDNKKYLPKLPAIVSLVQGAVEPEKKMRVSDKIVKSTSPIAATLYINRQPFKVKKQNNLEEQVQKRMEHTYLYLKELKNLFPGDQEIQLDLAIFAGMLGKSKESGKDLSQVNEKNMTGIFWKRIEQKTSDLEYSLRINPYDRDALQELTVIYAGLGFPVLAEHYRIKWKI